MAFDIATLVAADEADCEIVDADGKKTGWVWTFAGPGHPATIAIDNEMNAQRIARDAAKEKAQANGRKWKGDGETPEEAAERMREQSIGYIAARLLRWSEIEMAGVPYPHTKENARAILSNRAMGAVLDQANAFLIDERSFTRRSATS